MARGFTLVEMLVTMTVMLLVTGALFAILNPSHAAFQTQPEVSDLQQRLRVAADGIGQDLAMAGAGTYSGAAATGSLGRFMATVMPYRIGATSPDPPGTWRSDTFSVIYVPATASQATTKLQVEQGSAVIEVNIDPGCPLTGDGCGFQPGTTAVIYDESGAWDFFAVDEVRATSLVRRAGSRALSRAYAPGAHVARAVVAVFSVKNERGTDVPQLRRYDGDQTDMPLVDDVVGLTLEYFGDPAPPMLDTAAAAERPWTTYGPAPPPIGVADVASGYPPGENCVFTMQAGVQVPRLPSLSATAGALVPLPGSMLTDGPWCPGATFSNRFDADLLRVRQVHVTVRLQAGAASLRGRNPKLFLRPGTATEGGRLVPDQTVQFDVTPRNLNFGR
jgi:prepilin-type N-terminal cleavage/methylation domain-containing protein